MKTIKGQINIDNEQLKFWRRNGFLAIEHIIDIDQIKLYRKYYDDFISGKIDTAGHRSDLNGGGAKGQERIVQIMRPSLLLSGLDKSILHHKCAQIARQLLGDDMEMDFDMLIDKSPFTDTITPWHQDQAYWIDMPDKRALSCWVALDDATVENGCMWYIPRSHAKPLRPHAQINDSGALCCEASEEEGVAVPLSAGSVVIHHGATIHYSRGNSTENRRRAFILNFRSKKMIEHERANGFDHLGNRAVRSK